MGYTPYLYKVDYKTKRRLAQLLTSLYEKVVACGDAFELQLAKLHRGFIAATTKAITGAPDSTRTCAAATCKETNPF